MSLQVWLPLNGNLNNQGLNDGNPSLMGTGITYTSGKFGLAATFPNNCNSCIHMPGLRLQTGTFASWILVKGTGATSRQCLISEGRDSYNDGVEIYASQAGTTLYFKAHEKILSTTIELNKWYHIAGTFGNGEVKLYLNGALISTIAYTAEMTYQYASDLTLGKMSYSYTNTSNYFSFNGQLNDVRIYDHCLSQKEIEEISKGLVLHYKLDESNSNLLYTMPKSFSAAGYNAYQFTMTENLVADQTYTLQLWDVDVYHSAKTTAQTGVWVYWGGGSVHLFNWTGPTYFTQEGTNNYHADYLVKTFTVTSAQASGSGAANSWLNIYNSVGYVEGTLNMHIGAWKLEKGSTATSWEDSIDNNIVYDSSGYNHNGEIINTLLTNNNTPRYKSCMHISATNQKIHISNLITSGFGNSYSFAWWGKRNSNSPMFWGFSDGIRLNGMYLGNLWNTGDGSSNPLYQIGTTTQVTGPNVNVWHHYVMTGNGSKCYVYLDGELWAEAKTYKAISGTSIYINGWDSGTSYCSDNTDISDFRIYATALTDDQIKELYNTSATIDNNGNIYARELVEI